MSTKLNLSHLFFLLCLGFLFYLVWFIAKPFIGAIIFAGILVGAFHPIYSLMIKRWCLNKKIASLLTCFIIFVLVILPLFYVGFQLSREAINFYQYVREALTQEGVKEFFYGSGSFAKFFKEIMIVADLSPEGIEENILAIVQKASTYSVAVINGWLGNIVTLLLKFAIMMLVLFGLFINGDELKAYIFKLSPLPIDQEEFILDKFNKMNRVTLIGNGIGGVIQGFLAGVAFAIAGFPSVFMWSAIMVILAFIPLVGISIVYIPASIYLFITGKVTASIILFIFCSLVAFITENWFKPKFMGDQVQVNSILFLLFIIGGMGAWGMAGIFYGPVVCVVVMSMVDIYHQRYAKDLVFNQESIK